MKITTRLILSFLLVSVLPLAAVNYIGLQAMDQGSSLAVNESTEALKQVGEDCINQKALDVAQQVDLYLEAHPEAMTLSAEKFQADERLAAVAVQPVGKTGYTAVYDDKGVTHFHSNPKIVGVDLHTLANSLPSFWAIIEDSLGGQASDGYYEWKEADGTLRDKYMSCVPVGKTNLRVAATTYIDEFYQPVRDTETKMSIAFQATRLILMATMAIAGLLAALLGVWLALGISRPITAITNAAMAVESEHFEIESLDAIAGRKDELGRLAQVFQRMAREVYAREQRLKQQVQLLRIEIDEVKRQRQVKEIVETDFFQDLQAKARAMRDRGEQQTNQDSA